MSANQYVRTTGTSELVGQQFGLAKAGESSAAMTHWEKAATSRWGAYVSRIEERLIQQAHTLLGQPTEGLEVGCEGGRWTKMLANLGWQMTAIDVNPAALEACAQKSMNARFVLAKPTDTTLPCADKSKSLLLCIEVAPVIQSGWFVNEAARVLAEGGLLVGVAWNKASLRGMLTRFRYWMRRKNEGFYEQSYTTLRRNLLGAGFEFLREDGFCWGPFSRVSNSPVVPMFCKLERWLGLRRMPALSPWVGFIARKCSRSTAKQSLPYASVLAALTNSVTAVECLV